MHQKQESSSVIVCRLWGRLAVLLLASLLSLHAGTSYAVSLRCGENPVEIVGPVYAGTRIVAYDYALDLCHILVFANGVNIMNLVGVVQAQDVPYGEIQLDRPLKEGEIIVATTGDINGPESKSVIVQKVPPDLLVNGEQFPTPLIPPIVECQKSFAVAKLIKGGVRVPYEVSGSYSDTGAVWTPYDSTAVMLSWGLAENDTVTATQDMDKSFPQPSGEVSETVKKRNYPIPKPRIVDFVFGAKALNIHDAHGGAVILLYERDEKGNVTVHSRGIVEGSGIRPAEWKMGTLLIGRYGYCIAQFLCDEPSPRPLDCVIPNTRLRKPVVQRPICPNEDTVVINNTHLGLDLQLRVTRVDGSVDDYFVATKNKRSVVLLPQNELLNAGDLVTAVQGNFLLDSEWSDPVIVKQSNEPCLQSQRPLPHTGPPTGASGVSGSSRGGTERLPSQPRPSPGCTWIHVRDSVPSGWIMRDAKWVSTEKDSHLDYNMIWICRYDHLPVGTKMEVCGQAPTPPGWKLVRRSWDPTKCAGKPTIKPNNMKEIEKVN